MAYLAKGYLFAKQPNFGLVEIESWWRHQISSDSNDKAAFEARENIVGRGESGGYQYFLLFLQCFKKSLLFRGPLKPRVVWKRDELLIIRRTDLN